MNSDWKRLEVITYYNNITHALEIALILDIIVALGAHALLS
jgi:hypothetical protein